MATAPPPISIPPHLPLPQAPSPAWPIRPTGRIVILTGAGVSRESGLETFRDPDGIWARHRLEDVATPEGFARNPALVHSFYNSRRAGLLDPAIAPNPAHYALARLDAVWAGDLLIVTQNIDDLHERAGTRRLLHMHGELLKSRCTRCENVAPCRSDLDGSSQCEACGCIGCLRPHVVWFGEMPIGLERIEAALASCDLFIAIGTSGQVYPAAGFVQMVRRQARAHTVEVNLEPSEVHLHFAERLYGHAGSLVPALVERLVEAA